MLLVLLLLLLLLHLVSGQHSGDLVPRNELDTLLQDYAFRAFARPRTGTVYEGQSPSNLTGIRVAALRLRSGSLWRRGFSGYHEFNIPAGVVVHPYVERLALVYLNLGNWSSYYYHLPPGHTFLSPVIAVLAYDASNLSAQNLPLLDIRALNQPISVTFSDLVLHHGSPSMCAYFSLNGSLELSDVVNQNSCLTNNQGHFSIVTESSLSPPPATSPPPPPPPPYPEHRTGNNRRLWIILGSVIGGLALLVLLAVTISFLIGCLRRKKIRQMEAAAEGGVPLPMTNVGGTKAPVAAETRTRPAIETEFVP